MLNDNQRAALADEQGHCCELAGYTILQSDGDGETGSLSRRTDPERAISARLALFDEMGRLWHNREDLETSACIRA